jgi:heme-degrading monooxygenase HmoA
MFAQTPHSPDYAVVFNSRRASADEWLFGHGRPHGRTGAAAGFSGGERARGADGLGITVTSWAGEEVIATWRADVEHCQARE